MKLSFSAVQFVSADQKYHRGVYYLGLGVAISQFVAICILTSFPPGMAISHFVAICIIASSPAEVALS